MTHDFVVRPEAEADIDEAYVWYERRTVGLGDRFLDAVGATLEIIQKEPLRFPESTASPTWLSGVPWSRTYRTASSSFETIPKTLPA